MAVSKAYWKSYLKDVKKAYKKLRKYLPKEVHGQFFTHLHRTQAMVEQIISIYDGVDTVGKTIDFKKESYKILSDRIANLRNKIKDRRKRKLRFDDHTEEIRLVKRERKIIKDEIVDLMKQRLSDIPGEINAAQKYAKDQLDILDDEVDLLEVRYERYINGIQDKKALKKAKKIFKRKIKPNLLKLEF